MGRPRQKASAFLNSGTASTFSARSCWGFAKEVFLDEHIKQQALCLAGII